MDDDEENNMKNLKVFTGLGLLSAVALTATACGSNNNNSNATKQATNFKQAVPTKTAKKGGKVNVAIETDTPFTGIFSNELSISAIDSEVMQYGGESLFATDDEYRYTNDGAASIKIDQNAKTATIKLKNNVKWSDGQPVVAKDIEFAYLHMRCLQIRMHNLKIILQA